MLEKDLKQVISKQLIRRFMVMKIGLLLQKKVILAFIVLDLVQLKMIKLPH
jgi:hypothetical protein